MSVQYASAWQFPKKVVKFEVKGEDRKQFHLGLQCESMDLTFYCYYSWY